MNRCGIERADGIFRIGILCRSCSLKAIKKLVDEGRRFWSRPFDGHTECEACGALGQVGRTG